MTSKPRRLPPRLFAWRRWCIHLAPRSSTGPTLSKCDRQAPTGQPRRSSGVSAEQVRRVYGIGRYLVPFLYAQRSDVSQTEMVFRSKMSTFETDCKQLKRKATTSHRLTFQLLKAAPY